MRNVFATIPGAGSVTFAIGAGAEISSGNRTRVVVGFERADHWPRSPRTMAPTPPASTTGYGRRFNSPRAAARSDWRQVDEMPHDSQRARSTAQSHSSPSAVGRATRAGAKHQDDGDTRRTAPRQLRRACGTGRVEQACLPRHRRFGAPLARLEAPADLPTEPRQKARGSNPFRRVRWNPSNLPSPVSPARAGAGCGVRRTGRAWRSPRARRARIAGRPRGLPC